MIQQKNQAGQTPLQIAAYNEQIPILELFIKEAKQEILSIVERPCHKTLDFLLKQGVIPNTANSFKQSLLHIASQKGMVENVLALLQHGAAINAKDLSNRTALFLAVQQGHRAIVQVLLQRKADTTIASIEQETVFHAAAFYGYTQILCDLLQHPSCQKLIHAQDHDGKTSLHKAVWGSSKPDVVTLLIEKGADVNAKNKYDYTPLHWAAKHGHTASAEILIKAGAKLDIVNANQGLAFDLAIRHGQDDFIRFFLQVPAKASQEPLPSKDIEGYYYKRLLEAKKEGQVEEQILCLQIISYHYIERNDLMTGAKILNCALALIYSLPGYTHESRLSIFAQYLLHRLEQIEEMFLKSKGITLTLKPLAKYRNELKGIRKTCALNAKTSPIQETLASLTTEFKSLLSDLISDTQQILGKPPVKWACMGMGSMSRDEMCPYSDIEFAFLIEKESQKAMEYFRTLSQILELRIINLGETKFPIFGESYPSPTPDGFCMDAGGNTPLGVTGVYELIGTPKTLAQFQKIQWMDRSIILPNALSHVCLVAGKEKLVTEYSKEKKKVQELIDKKAKSKEKNSHVLATRLLAGHIEEFSPNLSKEKEETSAFGIKKELYRPFQEIIASLALFYQLKEKTTFTRIDELVALGVFSSKGAENLKKAITLVLTLRLKAHLFYQNEEEFLCHPEVGKPLDPHLMYFDEETLKTLQEIYRILIPFHRCAQEFLASQSKEVFNHSSFYDDSSTSQGAAFDKNLQYANAKQARQEAVALNPNDVKALLHLGLIEGKMGKSKDALPRYFKALELAKEKYGENHPDVATSYNNIGAVYKDLGEYEKALEYLQKASKIRLQVLGENHPDVALSYNNIGAAYKDLGEYEKALEYYQKSLKIRPQVLGENHPDVAQSYNNIGAVYKDLGEYEKALEYYQKSLKIRLQVLGENHPDVALSYNNIGAVYKDLGQYEKALEYYQKASKIRLQVLGENHPDVATSYNNIGLAYGKLGEYEKALEYYQKALKIRLQVLGENHPSVATSYNNIGSAYESLGQYEKALEYLQKASKIWLQVLGGNHPDVALSYNNIGAVYGNLGENEKALEYHQKSLKIRLQVLGENHPDVARSYGHIGSVYKSLGENEKALEYLQKASKIWLQVLGGNHPDVALSYNNIGAVYKDLGQYEKALEYHQKSLKITLQVLGENHPDVAQSYNNIGAVYYRLGQYEKALDYFIQSLEMRCKIYKKSHSSILNTLKWVIIIAKKLPASQLKSLKQTHAICVETLGADQELVKELLQLIS